MPCTRKEAGNRANGLKVEKEKRNGGEEEEDSTIPHVRKQRDKH